MSSLTALITGASGGIGYELACIFAENWTNLVLVARSKERLEEIAAMLRSRYSIRVHVIASDLSQPAAPQQIYEFMTREKIEIDYLVNNAGFGDYGMFAAADWQRQLSMITVNITALTHLTRLFLPAMVARGNGKILNVASTASFQPGPLMAVYYATKAYVLSFSEALFNEVEGTGVTVTSLCPGPTATGFQAGANLHTSRIIRVRKLPPARKVAELGYRAMLQGRMTVIEGWINRLLVFGARFAPRSLAVRIVRWIQG